MAMIKEIKEIIKGRREKNNDLFYIEPKCTSKLYGYEVVRRKDLYGIRKDGIVFVDPIYDEVTLYPHNIAVLKINDLCACFNIASNNLFLDFKYRKIDYEEGFLKLYRSSEKFGLYEIKSDKILIGCGKYEEYNLKDNTTEYIWARRGKYYDYIRRSTYEIVKLPAVTMAYDTPSGMFGKNENDIVSVYNAQGSADIWQLRHLARESGGYITLDNYTRRIQHIIDINGNILNI